MKSFIHISILFILCVFPIATHAYQLSVGPDISIDHTYVSDENLYMAGLNTWFDTTYENDIVSLGFNQVFKGSIFGDLSAVGNTIAVEGEIFEDVRIIANQVTLKGVTNKDLVIVANKVVFEKDAIVNGEMLIFAATVEHHGQLLGESQITANKITIDGSILAPTTLTTQSLVFESGAHIISEISYFSPQRAEIKSGANIQTNLNFNQIESIRQNDMVKRIFFGFVSFWLIIKLIATLFVIFMLTFVFKIFAQRTVDILVQKKAYVFLIGVISLILVPVFSALLFASLVLIPVSIMTLLIFGILIILMPAMSAIGLAHIYKNVFSKQKKHEVDFNSSALALVGLTFISFVPYVGDVVLYGLYIASYGAMTLFMYEHVRRRKIK